MSIAAPATNPASDLSLKLPATVGTSNQYLKNSSTAGTLEFGSLTGTHGATDFTISDGNLVVASGHGVDFSARGNAGGMTSELLDHYEEGTYTPGINGTDGNYGNASVTYSHQKGRYTRIGAFVMVEYDFRFTALSGGGGYLAITGLPYAVSDFGYHGFGIQSHSGNINDGGDGPRGIYANASADWFYIMQNDHDTTPVSLNMVSATAHWIGGFTYRCA